MCGLLHYTSPRIAKMFPFSVEGAQIAVRGRYHTYRAGLSRLGNYSWRLRSRKRTPFNSAPSSAVNDVMYSQTNVAIPAPNDP